jgi:hypothetical protein
VSTGESRLRRGEAARCTGAAVCEVNVAPEAEMACPIGRAVIAGCHPDHWLRHLPMNGGVLTTLVRMREFQPGSNIIHREVFQRVLIAALLVN